MRVHVTLGFVTVNVIFSLLAEGSQCPDDVPVSQVFTVGDTCYHFIETPSWKVSYEAADKDCRSRRGLLLTLANEETSTAVEDEITNRVDSHTILLGMTKQDDTWKWATGDAVTFNKFAQGSSADTNNCAKLKLMDTSVWEKVPCSASDWFSIYVCEHNERTRSITSGVRTSGNCVESLVAVLVSTVLVYLLH